MVYDLHNGHVNFGLWLGQVDPRRPVHCVRGLKRGRKGHNENHDLHICSNHLQKKPRTICIKILNPSSFTHLLYACPV